jgi:hypothetical protein
MCSVIHGCFAKEHQASPLVPARIVAAAVFILAQLNVWLQLQDMGIQLSRLRHTAAEVDAKILNNLMVEHDTRRE